jgi:hypothetical protein
MSGLTSAATSINENKHRRILCGFDNVLKLPVNRDWFSANRATGWKQDKRVGVQALACLEVRRPEQVEV